MPQHLPDDSTLPPRPPNCSLEEPSSRICRSMFQQLATQTGIPARIKEGAICAYRIMRRAEYRRRTEASRRERAPSREQSLARAKQRIEQAEARGYKGLSETLEDQKLTPTFLRTETPTQPLQASAQGRIASPVSAPPPSAPPPSAQRTAPHEQQPQTSRGTDASTTAATTSTGSITSLRNLGTEYGGSPSAKTAPIRLSPDTSRNDIMLLKWEMPGKYVEVAGAFPNPAWEVRLPLFKCPRTGVFWLSLQEALPAVQSGVYQFKYIVDDEWKCDMSLPTKDDGSGNTNNSMMVVAAAGILEWKHPAQRTVLLAGSFTEPPWKRQMPLAYDPRDSTYRISLQEAVPELRPGSYQFKYIVDDEWKCDPSLPTQNDGSGNINNVLHYHRPPAAPSPSPPAPPAPSPPAPSPPAPAPPAPAPPAPVPAPAPTTASTIELPARSGDGHRRRRHPADEPLDFSSLPDVEGSGSDTEEEQDQGCLSPPGHRHSSATDTTRASTSGSDSSPTAHNADRLPPTLPSPPEVSEQPPSTPAAAAAEDEGPLESDRDIEPLELQGKGWARRRASVGTPNATASSRTADGLRRSSGGLRRSSAVDATDALGGLSAHQPSNESLREDRLRRVASLSLDHKWPESVTAHLHSPEVLVDLHVPDDRLSTKLRLNAGAFMIPHPEKVETGGADAYFICEIAGGGALGVADGVGEWDSFGLSPKMFADELMRGCQQAAILALTDTDTPTASSAAPAPAAAAAAASASSSAASAAAAAAAAADTETGVREKDASGTLTNMHHYRHMASHTCVCKQTGSPTCSLTPLASASTASSKTHQPSPSNGHGGSDGDRGDSGNTEEGETYLEEIKCMDLPPEKIALRMMQYGYTCTRSYGASTALVAYLDTKGEKLGVAILGDSTMILLRRQKVYSMTVV
ncbi:unnamed protein product [Vitrella brassicaformis CCMP3155]|uniref:AMP-activated protein kinase glycogen-binding domain-containing protein n=1 Tax=Vitrella brassicaformis (strain CCMP3155) TaxID=1169540 RepID=A0A0G4FYK2_VITBC|nr:unnamed protein product [Vitrella brassicaformis CCMP3155]|eukprot:CEM20277.1 unnamed protein product [Vitrella brassicaformis CCMP3155]